MSLMGSLCCCRSDEAIPVADPGTYVRVQQPQGKKINSSAASSDQPQQPSNSNQPTPTPGECKSRLSNSGAKEQSGSAKGGPLPGWNKSGEGRNAHFARPSDNEDIESVAETSSASESEGGRRSAESRRSVGSRRRSLANKLGPNAHRNALQVIAGASLADLVASWSSVTESRKPIKFDENEKAENENRWLPRWPVIVKKVTLQEMKKRQTQPRLCEQYALARARLEEKLREDGPGGTVLYVIGQVSLAELEYYCRNNQGSVVFVQGLAGFNIVDLSAEGELVEAERKDVERICDATRCLLLNLTASDCAKVGFDRVQELFDTSLPDGKSKDVLNSYRASSFGSFAASTSRGKIKVTAEDGAATDGLIRSVDTTIGESVEKLRSFETQLYRDAIPYCRGDENKISIFSRVMAAVETTESHCPEDYLTQRTRGFGDPEAFNEMRNLCAAEITSAAYRAGGVLDGCETPVYDDWTVHQALRIMAGMQPLEMDSVSDLELHMGFVSDCMKFLYLNLSLGEYAVQVLSSLPDREHIVLHDVGSDTGPDDFPASALLMALTKYRPETSTRLLAVGGEPKYRTLRANLLRLLVPEVPGVSIEEAPFINGVSFPSPFVPVALVQTMATYASDVELLSGGGSSRAAEEDEGGGKEKKTKAAKGGKGRSS